MIKLLNPNQMTGIAYKERGKHEHPDLMEKLTRMLKMPVDSKKMDRNFFRLLYLNGGVQKFLHIS